MKTYAILQARYTYSHTFKPEPPAKPFEVFELSWDTVGRVKAPTVETALRYAKKQGFLAPAVQDEATLRAAPPPVQRDYFARPVIRQPEGALS